MILAQVQLVLVNGSEKIKFNFGENLAEKLWQHVSTQTGSLNSDKSSRPTGRPGKTSRWSDIVIPYVVVLDNFCSSKLSYMLQQKHSQCNEECMDIHRAATDCTVLTVFNLQNYHWSKSPKWRVFTRWAGVFLRLTSSVVLTCFDVVRTCPAWECWTLPGSTGSAAEAPRTRLSTAGPDETTAPPATQTRRGLFGRKVEGRSFNIWVMTASSNHACPTLLPHNRRSI